MSRPFGSIYDDSPDDIGREWNDVPPWRGPNGHDVKAPPPVKFKTLVDFCREYVPLAYAVEPLLRTSALYTLTARTGHGKTAFLIVTALAIATGRPDILGLEVARGRVAFLTFENPDDVRMRFMIAAFLLNIDLDEIAGSIVVLDIRIKPEEVLAKIQKLADADPFTLIIVDTFAAFFDGNDTNDATQGGEFMRAAPTAHKNRGPSNCIGGSAPNQKRARNQSYPLRFRRNSKRSRWQPKAMSGNNCTI